MKSIPTISWQLSRPAFLRPAVICSSDVNWSGILKKVDDAFFAFDFADDFAFDLLLEDLLPKDDTMSTTNIRIIAATKINTSIDTGKQNKTGGKKKVRNELFRGQKYATRRREKETTTTLLDEDGRRKQAF